MQRKLAESADRCGRGDTYSHAFEAARLDALEADKVEVLVAYWVSGDVMILSREFLKRIVCCV